MSSHREIANNRDRPWETEENLMRLVDDVVASRKVAGQNLSYNTIKRLILEKFSEEFFASLKAKVQQRLSNASGSAGGGGGGGAGAFEETEENLLQVVNDFIALKKSKNQNISYPTIKRHLLQHFRADFFERHKTTVQQRLENAFRRDPSNGRFIEDIQKERDPAAVRARHLQSIFANLEVVLADMKISHPYPVTGQYSEVLRQARQQVGAEKFAKFEAEIVGHLETFRAVERQARAKAEAAAAEARAQQIMRDRRNRSELRYFTDFDERGSIFMAKLTKPSERRRMTNLYAKTRSAANDAAESHDHGDGASGGGGSSGSGASGSGGGGGSSGGGGGNFIDRWVTQRNVTKQHKKNFEDIIDRLREGCAMWTRGDRASCLVKLQSICVDFAEVEVWLQHALSDSVRWTRQEANPNKRECMQILMLQEACFALFADTQCTDPKASELLQTRRSIRNILAVGRILQYFNLHFLRVSYYARLAMALEQQFPKLSVDLEQARAESDPFTAATLFNFFFEVHLQERAPADEGSEQAETDLANQAACDKRCHLVSYYGHMAYSRIRRMLRHRKRAAAAARGDPQVGRRGRRRASLAAAQGSPNALLSPDSFSNLTSPSIKNMHSVHMLNAAAASAAEDAQRDGGGDEATAKVASAPTTSPQRHPQPPPPPAAAAAAAAATSRGRLGSTMTVEPSSWVTLLDAHSSGGSSSVLVDAPPSSPDRGEVDDRDKMHTTVLIDVNLLASPADWVRHSNNTGRGDSAYPAVYNSSGSDASPDAGAAAAGNGTSPGPGGGGGGSPQRSSASSVGAGGGGGSPAHGWHRTHSGSGHSTGGGGGGGGLGAQSLSSPSAQQQQQQQQQQHESLPAPVSSLNNRNLMEEIREGLKKDHVWRIRTLYDKYKLDINDSPISLWLGVGGRRLEFEFIDGRRALAGSSASSSSIASYGADALGGGGADFMKLTQKAKYSTTSGCTILHAAILQNAHKIMQWALRSNADCFVRHSGTGQTALAMLQHNASRTKSARERCEKAMASFPTTPVPASAFGCGDSVPMFTFLRTCERNRPLVEAWLSQLRAGRSVNDIAGVDIDAQRREERRVAEEEAKAAREAKAEAQAKAEDTAQAAQDAEAARMRAIASAM